MKKVIDYWLLIISCCLLITACDLVNPEEQIPAFIQINSFELNTTVEQGANSAQITDVWVFVEDISLGIYELPATIPSLELGNQKVTVFPVIRENGNPSEPSIYPLYQRYETTVELIAENTVTINPTTVFANSTIFNLVESFEMNNHRLTGISPDDVLTMDGVGNVQFQGKEMVTFTSSDIFTELPTNNGNPVFLEFDYKTNVEFEIGLVGIDQNAQTPVEATVFPIILCPIDRWNKVYINLREALQVSQLPGYRLAFRASINDTGCGNVNSSNPEVLIDNIKFIHLNN